jgi:hypothetical protein
VQRSLPRLQLSERRSWLSSRLSEQFRALGGEAFVKQLDATHKAYGEALGITNEKPSPEAAPTLLELLRNWQEESRPGTRVSGRAKSETSFVVAGSKSRCTPYAA